MFYILILFGAALILLGIYIGKNQTAAEPGQPIIETCGMEEMKNRMEQMEQLLFESLLKQEEIRMEDFEEHEEPAVQEEAPAVRKPMPDNMRTVVEYEKEGLNTQEIANLTRMNKGEVLLLKNLSKHYSR